MIREHPRRNPDRRLLSVSIALAPAETRAWARTAETTSLGESIRLSVSGSSWWRKALKPSAAIVLAAFAVALLQ
jgi:hypothetical protein